MSDKHNPEGNLVLLSLWVLIGILATGCITIPGTPPAPPEEPAPVQTEQPGLQSYPDQEIPPPPPEPPVITPVPTKPPVSGWDPYQILPSPGPALNHTSILRDDTPIARKTLNTTYTETVRLTGYAIGKELNVTTGPFSVTYTVHPVIDSPRDVWVTVTVYDPWQQIIEQGGYNRGYSNQETQKITIYREGRHYLIIDGAFASVQYSIQTGDPAPVPTRTQEPPGSISEEEMRMRMRMQV